MLLNRKISITEQNMKQPSVQHLPMDLILAGNSEQVANMWEKTMNFKFATAMAKQHYLTRSNYRCQSTCAHLFPSYHPSTCTHL